MEVKRWKRKRGRCDLGERWRRRERWTEREGGEIEKRGCEVEKQEVGGRWGEEGGERESRTIENETRGREKREGED